MKKCLAYVALCLLILKSVIAAEPQGETAEPPKPEAGSPDYVLQPSDLVRVQVYQEEDLTAELRLTQEGKIRLNLIGTIELKDKTLRQARDLIRDLYARDYLVNPEVTISVTDYSKRAVNVLGQVGSPGPVYFPPEEGLDLIQVITRAGGFTRLADKKKVRLTRTKPDGTTEIFEINAEKILNGQTKEMWPMQKGDTVSVAEKLL